MDEQKDDKVILNGKEMTKAEFETERQKLTEKKIQLVEVSPNTYKTRMYD